MNDTTEAEPLERTALHALHLELDARMVPYAGFEMPVQYANGILAEHRHTRAEAGLFDVSHMGQSLVSGDRAGEFLESLSPGRLIDLAAGRQIYSVLTNDAGGVIDDLMIARVPEGYWLVYNASRRAPVRAHLEAAAVPGVDVSHRDDRALIAVQGPRAERALASIVPGVESLTFMDSRWFEVDGGHWLVSRSGYTGEDGFEISTPAEAGAALARGLLADDAVAPVGLGARDSLRLEAGLVLYGHELDETTTPVEAGIAFAIARCRRTGGARAAGFPGAAAILDQLEHPPATRRVGLRVDGRALVREGAALHVDGTPIGGVTSGGFGATVGGPIALGAVDAAHAGEGARMAATVRGKEVALAVCALPFVPHRYRRKAPAAG